MRAEASRDAEREPALAGFLHEAVLRHPSLESALSSLLAGKLANHAMTASALECLIDDALIDPDIRDAVLCDLQAVITRDPATLGYTQPLLYFKGFQSIQSYRVAHYYWQLGHKPLAFFLQSRISEVFAVDIHPAAKIGRSIMFDHATSVVIGATAVVGDDFSMLHEVTLGGTGKEDGDRHPKIGKGVMIGAGAKVLGNIKVGDCAKIGSGSVVLKDVEAHTTVTGVPARVIDAPAEEFPSLTMNQMLN